MLSQFPCKPFKYSYKEEDDAGEPDIFFELFVHSTRFCGLQVVFLGLYNGQKMEVKNEEDLVTYSKEDFGKKSYVRVILLKGKMQGAVIIGDTTIAVSWPCRWMSNSVYSWSTLVFDLATLLAV